MQPISNSPRQEIVQYAREHLTEDTCGDGALTPLTGIIRDTIHHSGPMRFHRFMDLALYHPDHGYYRRGKDPFGKGGDYYTAEQIQPVFGTLIAARIRALFQELGNAPDLAVVELGAGRGEMAPAFSEFRYIPVDVDTGSIPERFSGVVFANEFFDALPVDVVVKRGEHYREMLVDWIGERFRWTEGGRAEAEPEEYLRCVAGEVEEGNLVEVSLETVRWLERIARSLERGYLFTIDYGYTARELVRFPQGTLMSYRRHAADDDVLADPGERDITAHVNFDALQLHGETHGLKTVRFERLARTLMEAGEPDQFAAALAADGPAEQVRLRLQLKALLYGMGESFRTLLQGKLCTNKNGPENSGPC